MWKTDSQDSRGRIKLPCSRSFCSSFLARVPGRALMNLCGFVVVTVVTGEGWGCLQSPRPAQSWYKVRALMVTESNRVAHSLYGGCSLRTGSQALLLQYRIFLGRAPMLSEWQAPLHAVSTGRQEWQSGLPVLWPPSCARQLCRVHHFLPHPGPAEAIPNTNCPCHRLLRVST